MADIGSRILYEDNHLIILNKKCGELVQGDETGDRTLADDVRSYLKDAYHKEGNVYLGIPHRLDRPTSGIVIYTKTEKALVRMNEEFKGGGVKKTYWAVVDRLPEKPEGTLVHYIIRDPRTNKSIALPVEKQGSK
ncbi:MAG: RNA pseudouridine synthase, partial [Sphaerochaeta sp.]|nr:RNA pseudouridine synthase [Sphaerochaeta sp.]